MEMKIPSKITIGGQEVEIRNVNRCDGNAVACAMEGRKCIGVEIDKGYYDLSKKRITEVVANKSLFEPSEMGEKAEEITLF